MRPQLAPPLKGEEGIIKTIMNSHLFLPLLGGGRMTIDSSCKNTLQLLKKITIISPPKTILTAG
jgi:hypothetical protein